MQMITLESSIASHAHAQDGVLTAFSGGVDSAVVLQAACRAVGPHHVTAVYLQTMLHPAAECAQARALAESMGAAFTVLQVDELRDAGIENNPPDRCYRCKRLLFTRLREMADARGITVMLDGTNADDLGEYRPGLRALRELGVISPLAALGITKAQVRAMAAEYGLCVSDKPSSPCLATRLEYGAPLLREDLESIGEAEAYLHTLGFTAVRVRKHHGLARIEIRVHDFENAVRLQESIIRKLRDLGFLYVTLDLEGLRSGSMDLAVTGIAGRAGKDQR